MDIFYSVPHTGRYVSELQKQRFDELVKERLEPFEGAATPEQVVEAINSAAKEVYGDDNDGELKYEMDQDQML